MNKSRAQRAATDLVSEMTYKRMAWGTCMKQRERDILGSIWFGETTEVLAKHKPNYYRSFECRAA